MEEETFLREGGMTVTRTRFIVSSRHPPLLPRNAICTASQTATKSTFRGGRPPRRLYLRLPGNVLFSPCPSLHSQPVLWDHALGRNFKRQLHSQLSLEAEEVAPLLSFWAGLHDIGKASPAFQRKSDVIKARLEASGYNFPTQLANHAHGPISYEVLSLPIRIIASLEPCVDQDM